MKRRYVLSLSGTALAGFAGLAGCLGSGSSTPAGPRNADDLPADPDPNDGYPPAFETAPEERSIDPGSYPTTEVDGTAVPLAPIEDVYYWYARGEARFADARGPDAYTRSHVYGAVLSPAPDGLASDPVRSWPASDRIVCYCGCPHHLSSMRAASLLREGYERVYVIDEGFWEWHDRSYPMTGEEVAARPALRIVRGRTDAGFAGETAWARHPPSGQREAAPIAADGSFSLHLRFADVTGASVIVVETPDFRVAAPLSELTGSVVSGSRTL